MIYLLIVSFIWAFSFGLIKGNLTGLDSNFVAFARLAISLLVFLPFLRLRGLNPPLAGRLVLVGMLQYGLMYTAYIYSYQFLQAYEVALFTIFTPLYVTLSNDLFRHRFSGLHLFTAGLAVLGAGVIVYSRLSQGNLLLGFLIVQLSNLCFAFGQIYYREILRPFPHLRDRQIFALLYLGAVLLTATTAGITTEWGTLQLTTTHLWTLLYLGVLASGICFFLWNYGARQVNAGTLAVFNNLKVPLAVAVSLLVFGESTDLLRLFLGGSMVLAALGINQSLRRARRVSAGSEIPEE